MRVDTVDISVAQRPDEIYRTNIRGLFRASFSGFCLKRHRRASLRGPFASRLKFHGDKIVGNYCYCRRVRVPVRGQNELLYNHLRVESKTMYPGDGGPVDDDIDDAT